MTTMSQVWCSVRGAAVAALTVGLLLAPLAADAAGRPAPRDEPGTAALEEFQQRLKDYVRMRTELAGKLKPLSSTVSASELSARQEALGAAIRTARQGAKRGDLIPEAAAAQLRAIVVQDFRDRGAEARKAAVREVAGGVRLTINRHFPENAALPTVPPLLLAKLPALPDNLQYRFIDRHLVILDGDTQIIIDYVQDVLPLS